MSSNLKVERQKSCYCCGLFGPYRPVGQFNDHDVGQIQQEVEAGQHPEWKDIADRSPVYKRTWDQFNSPVVKDGVLKRHWESADGRTKTVQTALARREVKVLLPEIYGGPSGGHVGVNKTLDKVREQYY
jgi:hypothetical protein